jgi:hypothetical protein
VYKTDINKCKIKSRKEKSKNRADCGKSVNEAKVCNGLQCPLRRRKKETHDDDDDDDDDVDQVLMFAFLCDV